MRVAVTVKDIVDGERDFARRCPVALALRRATGDPWAVWGKVLTNERTHDDVLAPESVTQFVDDYDNAQPVKPFAFELVA